MAKRVLVGVDFSPYSKKVVEQALLCAKKWKAVSVDLVHVVPFVPHLIGERGANVARNTYLQNVEVRLQKFFKQRGSQVRFHVLVGVPHDELLGFAKKNRSEIIFLGHKSKSAVERFFLGTTAERVALKAKVPVWIHRGTGVVKPNKILVPYDFSKGSDRAYREAQSILGVKSKDLTVVHASLPVVPLLDYPSWQYLEEAHEKWMVDASKKLKAKFHSPTKVIEGDPAESICKELNKFDLCVMATQGEGRILGSLGSVTARVLRRSPKPVLVVRG